MFDLRSKSSRFVALALAAVTTASALTFIPAVPSQAAAGTVSDGLCEVAVSETSGVTVDSLDGYCYVAFKSTGINYSWTPPSGVTKVNMLAVGGGGGGASRHSGGGGAGGLLNIQDLTINSSALAISVGAGGNGGGSSVGENGTAGSNTVVSGGGISTRTANGGGYGATTAGGSLSASGSSAGSGGGGGNGTGTGSGTSTRSTGTVGQGNGGGWGHYSNPWAGGGGGGSAAAGGDATSSVTGSGGNGSAISWITPTASASLGVGQISSTSVYFAGGGSGGGTGGSGMTVGAAGLGGGGAGQYGNTLDGVSGSANTGGGGGGSGQNGGWGAGGAGGSGVVVVRYLAPQQVFSYNASDINSYDSSVGTAINDLSTANRDATLTAGSNSTTATYSATTGTWSFAGVANNAGPYASIGITIQSDGFSAIGLTADFEADFGGINNWERIFDLGVSGQESSNVYVGRDASTSNLILGIWHNNAWQGGCVYPNGIAASGTMQRYTISIDGTTCRVWINGGSLWSTPFTLKPITGKVWASNFIAKSNWNADNSFEGSIKSVRLFSGALTPTQIGSFTYKTVTYNANGSTSSNSTAVTSGSLRVPAAITRTGYTFGGWNTQADGNGTNYLAGASYTPSVDATLYAKWTANTYSVTYSYNGANNNNLTVSNSYTSGGSAINLPNPTKTGYKFLGWYSDSGLNTFVANGATTYSPSGSTTAITLYAKWQLATLVISYNASDVNSYNSSGGATVNDLSAGGTYDGTLTAGTNSSTASFSGTTGSLSFGGGANNAGPFVNLPSISTTQFASSGMTFDFEADFGAVADSWESLISFSVSGGNGNTLYVGRYGTTNEIILEVYNGTSSVGYCKVAGIPTAGHTINRWTISIDGTNCRIWKDGTSLLSTAMTAKPLTGLTWAASFIAKNNFDAPSFEGTLRSMRVFAGGYTPDEIGAFDYKTISFDTNAGSSSIGSTRYTSGTVKLPAGPTRTGYTFTNWYADANATTLVGAAGATYTPTATTTLYAGWTANPNTINYNYNGATAGNSTTSTSFTAGDSPLVLPTPTKTGYYFGGWYSDSAFTTKVGAAGANYSPTSNGATINLYALWSAYRSTNLVINVDATQTSSYPSDGSRVTSIAPGRSTITTTDKNITRDTTQTPSGSLKFETGTAGRYVNLGGGASHDSNIDGAITVETWIKCSALKPTWNIIASRWFTAPDGLTGVRDWHFSIHNNRLNLYTTGQDDLSGAKDFSVSGCSNSEWLLVGFSLSAASNGTLQFYVNGRPDGAAHTNVSHSAQATAVLLLGDARVSTAFQGYMSRFRIYDTALSSADILTNFNNEASTYGYATRTVTFDANGGSGSMSDQSANTATNLTSNAFTRTGYTFSGWNTVALGGGTAYANNASYAFSADTTLYAQWAPNNKTVTFNNNSGSGTMTAQVTNVATNLTANTFTRNGFSFAGWNTQANGGGTSYADAASYAFTADVTLYAQWSALPNKTVTFNNNSGSGTMTAQVNNVATNLTANTFTRNGFSFAGWNTQANGGGTSYADAASYAFTADVTLYAQWTALPNKTVTFNNNSGSGTMTAQVTNVSTVLTANSFTRSGFTFASWNTAANGSGTTYANSALYAFTADVTLYAQWTALPNKTVIFDANNGTGSMSNQVTHIPGSLTSNSYTRSGYTFAGWNTSANGTGTSYADAATYSFTADATLFAQWTAINYGITYNASTASSGAVPTDSANYNIGRSVAILGNSGSLVRNGYTFAGWTVASDGSGTVLVSGSTLTFSAANINVYAKWTANTYTISYNVNGATGAQANTSDSYTTAGSAVTLSAVGTMAKAGHTFNGWATSANGSPIAGTYTTTANVTLYALWSINTITVTYDKGTASGSSLSAHSFTSFPGSAGTGNYGTRLNLSNSVDSTITFNSETYTFVGWNDGSSIYAPGTSFLLQNNVTMTAIWALTHAVRYTFNGGTAANSTSSVDAECTLAGSRCVDLQAITLNAAPTRDGYTFAGWRDQSGADFAAGASVSVLVSSYLFYAQWTPIAYTVTYVPNGGGSTPTETSKNIGDTFTVANAPSRTGYDFGGWFDGSVTYGPGATYTVGSASVSFSAQWIAHVYTINYDWNGGSGTAVADANYTVGTTGITLPGVTDQVKDGYTFGGWATSNGGIAIASPFVPTASATLYAVWGSGSYNITYAPELGTLATTTVTVANGNSINLETPTRQGFVFDGWFTAQTGGTRVGGGNSQFTPAASRTLHARWTQASIFGIPIGNLNRLGQLTASGSANSTYSGSNANSSVAVNVPSGALPNGTSVNIDMISDTTHASSLINGDKSFILSVAVSWLASDGTVPNTASGKSISVTLNNPGIKAGALIYSIQGVSVVLLGTATQDGTVTFELTQDPGIYVVATSPSAPQNASATATTSSATISWQAPSSDGGSPITGYTVTLNTGATCTTTGTLSCTISSLAAGTTYTYTVSATNSVGTGPTVSGSFNSSAANRTVTFDSNGGSGAMVNQITNVATALTSNAFAKTGYNFAGWNTAANGSGTAYANSATYAFSADVTLYAQWTLIPATPPAPTPSTPQYERPDAPTSVAAKISGTSITVSWSAPVNTGGTAIVNYRVVSTSGMACITTDTSCTFNDVNKDVRYSFTLTASNGYRDSLPSVASNSVLIPSVLLNQNALVASGSQSTRGNAVKIVVTGGTTGASIIYEVVNGTAKGCAIDGEGWLTATASGTCLVTVTMLGDTTYKPVSSAPTAVVFLCKLVAQAPLTVNASGSTSVSLSTTGGSGSGAVSYSVTDGTADCTLVDNVIKVAKAGTCVVVATKAADDVYESATSAPLTVNVKPVITSSTPVVKVSPIKHVVTVAPTGNPILLGSTISKPIIFGADSAKLDAGDIKQLKSVAAYVKVKKLSVLVTGFAKASGKGTFIEKLLATSRAKAVATYLRKLGVNVDISYAGYGAYNKAKPSINDRRVELRWVAKD